MIEPVINESPTTPMTCIQSSAPGAVNQSGGACFADGKARDSVSNWHTILKLLAPTAERRANSCLRAVPLANNRMETLLQPIARSIATAANSRYKVPPMLRVVSKVSGRMSTLNYP
jgi:hypothetical protein